MFLSAFSTQRLSVSLVLLWLALTTTLEFSLSERKDAKKITVGTSGIKWNFSKLKKLLNEPNRKVHSTRIVVPSQGLSTIKDDGVKDSNNKHLKNESSRMPYNESIRATYNESLKRKIHDESEKSQSKLNKPAFKIKLPMPLAKLLFPKVMNDETLIQIYPVINNKGGKNLMLRVSHKEKETGKMNDNLQKAPHKGKCLNDMCPPNCCPGGLCPPRPIPMGCPDFCCISPPAPKTTKKPTTKPTPPPPPPCISPPCIPLPPPPPPPCIPPPINLIVVPPPRPCIPPPPPRPIINVPPPILRPCLPQMNINCSPLPMISTPPLNIPWELQRPHQQSIFDAPIHPERIVAEAVMDGVVSSSGQCVDMNSRCPNFAIQGMCDSPSLFNQANKGRHPCQLSCGMCKGNGFGPGYWMRKNNIAKEGKPRNLLNAIFSKKIGEKS